MAAYIFKDSLSKPRFRADLPRPIDALRYYPESSWQNLSIIGEAGLEALRNGIDAREFEIFHNREQMLLEQDFAVFEREGLAAIPAWVAWAAAGISVATSVYSIIQANKLKTPGNINRTQESATNRIQARENEPRVNQRVENNYGQLRNFFTQMSLPYIRCENNQQAEYSYMSAGKGRYSIDDVRDGRTLGKSLGEWSMRAFRPFESPNNASPYKTIGPAFSRDIFTTFQSEDLTRDELDPPNDLLVSVGWVLNYVGGKAEVTQQSSDADQIDMRDHFNTGQNVAMTDVSRLVFSHEITILEENKTPPIVETLIPIDIYSKLNFGTGYVVESVTETKITLTIPAALVSIWAALPVDFEPIPESYQIPESGFILDKSIFDFDTYNYWFTLGLNPTIKGDPITEIITRTETNGITPELAGIIGPFEVDKTATSIQYNLYSDALYYDAGGNKTSKLTVEGTATVREIDINGVETGQSQSYPWLLESNNSNIKKQACDSFDIVKPYQLCTIEFKRTSNRDFEFQGNVRDIVEITELYFHRDDGKLHFGDKTTLQFRRTQTTYGVGKASKVSALTTSELNINGTWTATRYFDDIICDSAADPVFGRRSAETVAQMRLDLRRARDDLTAYFGRDDVAYFDFCIDSENVTFESFVQMVGSAVFCTPYLKQSIRFSPDIEQPIDTAIFGHGNKLIADESLKYSFDDLRNKNYDCVEVKWRNPDNMDTQEVFYIPSQGVNPNTLDLNGVRNERNAEIHGWREWYRIQYQRYSYECTVGLEGTQLIPNQRIGIVNNCCGESYDGSIVGWDGGVNVRFSQKADLSSGGYKIVIQNPQGGVGVFGVVQGVDVYHGVLDSVPTFEINTHLKENLTIYRIAKEDELINESYALQQPELSDRGIKLKAVNYAPEVYSKDHI